MSGTEFSPQYLRIAISLAERIAGGEMPVGKRISGRSLLASEYAVSPETIRRALKLLSDMKIVAIKDKSGVFILSADNAKRYLKNFEGWSEQREMRKKLKELLAQSEQLNRQISDAYTGIAKSLDAVTAADRQLPTYESHVRPDSPHIGKSIGSLQFWQSTGATIIAIRRVHSLIVSPGPYAEIYGGDVLVFVGDASAVHSVERFINGAPYENEGLAEQREESDDSI
jgi:K+/H+ antiporter YhaU regulatory subunit KhtT